MVCALNAWTIRPFIGVNREAEKPAPPEKWEPDPGNDTLLLNYTYFKNTNSRTS